MRELLIRCSSIGKITAEPTKAAIAAGEVLSVGAKTHVRELVAQDVLGIDFDISSKAIEKGNRCEQDSIDLLNEVRGLSLTKNTERKTNAWITGECDLYDEQRRRGHDIKTSWSAATFPITRVDCEDKLYEWQMRGYMWLWDAESWNVDYCLVDTPEDLCRYEPVDLHIVSHIPPHMRLTTWTVTRDRSLEQLIARKVEAARAYYFEVLSEFGRTHQRL